MKFKITEIVWEWFEDGLDLNSLDLSEELEIEINNDEIDEDDFRSSILEHLEDTYGFRYLDVIGEVIVMVNDFEYEIIE